LATDVSSQKLLAVGVRRGGFVGDHARGVAEREALVAGKAVAVGEVEGHAERIYHRTDSVNIQIGSRGAL
jgi:hypothetical protein